MYFWSLSCGVIEIFGRKGSIHPFAFSQINIWRQYTSYLNFFENVCEKFSKLHLIRVWHMTRHLMRESRCSVDQHAWHIRMNYGLKKYKTSGDTALRVFRKFRIYAAGISTIKIQSKYFSTFVYDKERHTHISSSYMTH